MRRLAQAFFVAFLLMVFAFLLIRLIPGDPAMILLGDSATEGDVIATRKTGLGELTVRIRSVFGRYVSIWPRRLSEFRSGSGGNRLSIVQKRPGVLRYG